MSMASAANDKLYVYKSVQGRAYIYTRTNKTTREKNIIYKIIDGFTLVLTGRGLGRERAYIYVPPREHLINLIALTDVEGLATYRSGN